MYENMTYENIMADMIANAPANIDTREGSLFYNACSRQALKLEEAYIQMDLILDNMVVDTMDEEHLVNYGKERGILRNEATYAEVKAEFNQEINIGERFSLNDYNYIVISNIESYSYVLRCETPGDKPNNNIGELESIEYIDDWQGGSITQVLVPGIEEEDLELFRERVIKSFNAKSFGGNRAQYKEYLNSMSQVGGCKVTRRKEGEENITIYFLSNTYGVPTEEVVKQVQEEIDPTMNSGEGYGMAPICHKVKILSVTGIKVNITSSIVFDDGFSFETVKEKIKKVIDDYLLELNKTWEDSDSITVRISQIESRIVSLEEVVDITDTKINDMSANLILDTYSICERGEVNVI